MYSRDLSTNIESTGLHKTTTHNEFAQCLSLAQTKAVRLPTIREMEIYIRWRLRLIDFPSKI